MKVGSIGYNHIHDCNFSMNMSEGVGCWLLLLIKTQAQFTINGREYDVRPNSFVVLSSDCRCTYRASGDSYADDWLFAEVGDTDEELLRGLEIPINEPVYLGNMDELSQLMHIMTYEHYSVSELREQIVQKYLEIFLLKLSRKIISDVGLTTELYSRHNDGLNRLRARIYNMPDTVPDIDGMAQEIGLSRSGFQHLYKKCFGVCVTKDVIHGRIERAKQLLSSTTLTIGEISERCGYSNYYHFIRQFKQICGKTPGEYRKNI